MQDHLELLAMGRAAAGTEMLRISGRPVSLHFRRNRRARRYILRVLENGTARVTIPRGGSEQTAREFAARQASWIEKQLGRQQHRLQPRVWEHGSEIFFRGVKVKLALDPIAGHLEFADQRVPLTSSTPNYRALVEAHLWRLAEQELVPRTLELAVFHSLEVKRVRVRNQRSRWGSCSARGTICLNWRLIQAPPFVRDYLIVHELMHLKEMNHSARYWRCVAAAMPDYRIAEQWLNLRSALLRE